MALHFRRATSIYGNTLPFVLLRLGVGLLLGVVTVLYFGFVVWVGHRLLEAGTISGWIAVLGLLLSIGLFAWVWRLFTKYVLYVIKAAHIAVIAHVIEICDVPENQIQYGKDQVTERFTETSALFAVDQVVKAVVKQFNGGVVSFSRFFSAIPALKNLIQLLGRAIAIAASYIDEAIVAHMFVSDDDDPWRSARDGGRPLREELEVGARIDRTDRAGNVRRRVRTLAGADTHRQRAERPLSDARGRTWVVVAGLFLTVYTGVLKPWVKTVVITTFLRISRRDSGQRNGGPDRRAIGAVRGTRAQRRRRDAGRAAATDRRRARSRTQGLNRSGR